MKLELMFLTNRFNAIDKMNEYHCFLTFKTCFASSEGSLD